MGEWLGVCVCVCGGGGGVVQSFSPQTGKSILPANGSDVPTSITIRDVIWIFIECLDSNFMRWIVNSGFFFLRYVSDGGTTALQENEARLREVEGRADKLKSEKEAVSSEIDKLKNDISKQQVSL